MIVVNLDVMMAKRKMSLSQLSEKVDITLANLSILKNNKAKAVRFSTLEAICAALDCQPGDILEFVPDEEAEPWPPGARLRPAKSGPASAVPAFSLLAAQLFPPTFFSAAWPGVVLVLLLGWIPVSFCPWYLWGSASGAGQIAEDGTQCTAGHLLRIVSGGGQSADLPRKAAGAVAVSHNAVSDTPSDADAIKAALLESLLLEVSRDVSAFAVYRVRQAVQPL